jgi:hypothetical protein
MNLSEAFSQGARCGHVEGKGRAGAYIIGEEILLSYDAGDNQIFPPGCRALWEQGYRSGYKLAAEGSELPNE